MGFIFSFFSKPTLSSAARTRRPVSAATPSVDGNTLTMKWQVTYTKSGAPDLVISGVETAIFEGDRIGLLRDEFDPEAQKGMEQWMAKNGAKLA